MIDELDRLRAREAAALMHTYGRQPVAFVRGEGAWLYDGAGRAYLDGLSGLAVTGLGHAHPDVADAVAAQASTLVHTSNLYFTRPQIDLAEGLADTFGWSDGRTFFCNPGAEANEAAITLARLPGRRRDPDAVMGSFAADHLIRDEETFVAAIGEAVAGALDGRLMTVGIRPTHAETGYGYLQCGRATGPGPVREVVRFKEKPTPEVAVDYVASGEYLWNAGMFVWRVEAFLAELARQQPAMHATLERIVATPHPDASADDRADTTEERPETHDALNHPGERVGRGLVVGGREHARDDVERREEVRQGLRHGTARHVRLSTDAPWLDALGRGLA